MNAKQLIEGFEEDELVDLIKELEQLPEAGAALKQAKKCLELGSDDPSFDTQMDKLEGILRGLDL